ncbi:MAG: Cell wall surface anchor family protein [Parcubacteria group bacterium GW2011_GWA2_47_7]|nr:MAG: Cell wall surface anchor family protein [Parcubacteria group bacterium GW2011_GWA2_47_7]
MKYLGTGLIAATLLLSTTAQALTVSGSGDASVGVGADSGNTIDVGATVYTNASTTGSASKQGNEGSASSASASGESSATIQATSLVLTRADISLGSGTNATVTAPTAVKTSADLSAYASTVLLGDENASALASSDTEVSFAYKQRAKLFGLIPIFVTATVHVSASGETSVSYPWYVFLATTDSASLTSDVEAATKATLSSTEGASTTFSAAAQAQLLSEIHTAMKSNLEATLAAEGKATSSVQ